jgi:hypothetical protein
MSTFSPKEFVAVLTDEGSDFFWIAEIARCGGSCSRGEERFFVKWLQSSYDDDQKGLHFYQYEYLHPDTRTRHVKRGPILRSSIIDRIEITCYDADDGEEYFFITDDEYRRIHERIALAATVDMDVE